MKPKDWKVWRPVVESIIAAKLRKMLAEIQAQRDLRRAR